MAQMTGLDFVPPDIRAKVTGRAKYAEDIRADGMVFCLGWCGPGSAEDGPENAVARGLVEPVHGPERRCNLSPPSPRWRSAP